MESSPTSVKPLWYRECLRCLYESIDVPSSLSPETPYFTLDYVKEVFLNALNRAEAIVKSLESKKCMLEEEDREQLFDDENSASKVKEEGLNEVVKGEDENESCRGKQNHVDDSPDEKTENVGEEVDSEEQKPLEVKQNVEPKVKRFKECLVCGEHIIGNSELDHVLRNHKDMIKCFRCSKVFKSLECLKGHNRRLHLAEKGNFVCDICNKSFTRQDLCRAHKRTAHSPASEAVCPVCGKQVKRRSLTEHLHAYHPGEGKSPFKCKQCSKTFKFDSSYKQHLKLMHDSEAKGFLCQICGQKFRRKDNLTDHIAVHGEPTLECNQCGKRFRRKGRLAEHLLRVHGEGSLSLKRNRFRSRFPCDHCSNVYKTKESLVAHRNRYMGLRPFVCSQCDAAFHQSSALYQHRQFKHASQIHEERVIQCSQCVKKFRSEVHLQYHTKKVHEGKRRFQCNQCPKAYYTQANLRDHMNTHTGERPYVCSHCGTSFGYKCSLRLHELTVHKDKNGESNLKK